MAPCSTPATALCTPQARHSTGWRASASVMPRQPGWKNSRHRAHCTIESPSGAPGRRQTQDTCVATLTCSTTFPGHTGSASTASSSACSCSTDASPFSMPLRRTRSIQCFASFTPFLSARSNGTPSLSRSASAIRPCTVATSGFCGPSNVSMAASSQATASVMQRNSPSTSPTTTLRRRCSFNTLSGCPKRMRSLLVSIFLIF
mmetsp:Transcript_153266/g.372124  ORF Transcript_153266/g.372124 Transcript_153266/m.372124 type:complete len:203 (-) Transcript_153266:304-912(-)